MNSNSHALRIHFACQNILCHSLSFFHHFSSCTEHVNFYIIIIIIIIITILCIGMKKSSSFVQFCVFVLKIYFIFELIRGWILGKFRYFFYKSLKLLFKFKRITRGQPSNLAKSLRAKY